MCDALALLTAALQCDNALPLAARLRSWHLGSRVAANPKLSVPECMGGHADRVSALTYAADGRTLARAGSDATVRLYGSASGAAVGEVALVSPGHATFDPVNKRLVEAHGEALRYLFDLPYDEAGSLSALPRKIEGEPPKPTLLRAPEKVAVQCA